jgi:hypothetical protein
VHVYVCTLLNLSGGMLLFPEDESGESSQQEEEESEAGETDEQTPRITPSPTNSSNGGGKSLIL